MNSANNLLINDKHTQDSNVSILLEDKITFNNENAFKTINKEVNTNEDAIVYNEAINDNINNEKSISYTVKNNKHIEELNNDFYFLKKNTSISHQINKLSNTHHYNKQSKQNNLHVNTYKINISTEEKMREERLKQVHNKLSKIKKKKKELVSMSKTLENRLLVIRLNKDLKSSNNANKYYYDNYKKNLNSSNVHINSTFYNQTFVTNTNHSFTSDNKKLSSENSISMSDNNSSNDINESLNHRNYTSYNNLNTSVNINSSSQHSLRSYSLLVSKQFKEKVRKEKQDLLQKKKQQVLNYRSRLSTSNVKEKLTQKALEKGKLIKYQRLTLENALHNASSSQHLKKKMLHDLDKFQDNTTKQITHDNKTFKRNELLIDLEKQLLQEESETKILENEIIKLKDVTSYSKNNNNMSIKNTLADETLLSNVYSRGMSNYSHKSNYGALNSNTNKTINTKNTNSTIIKRITQSSSSINNSLVKCSQNKKKDNKLKHLREENKVNDGDKPVKIKVKFINKASNSNYSNKSKDTISFNNSSHNPQMQNIKHINNTNTTKINYNNQVVDKYKSNKANLLSHDTNFNITKANSKGRNLNINLLNKTKANK